MNLNWFKKGVIYQIYPRSFYDSDADGIGDIKGITAKLDYIKSLNVDIIWISPIFQSPNKDNGYDVSDYCAIMPEFGTMSDFDELLSEAHQKDLKIVLDLVPNHTSVEHNWFKQAKQSKNNPYRDFYIWKKPQPDGSPPNNWPSFFGGSAWTLDENTGEYYLHLFTKYQPDLNWENPKVRESIYEVMKFWLNKGIDGFRMDVVTLLSKDLSFQDIDPKIGFRKIIENHYANGPNIHQYLHEMHEEVMKHYDAFSMGEGVGVTQDNAHLYVGEDREELDMIYHFDILENNIVNGKYEEISEFDLINIKKIFRNWHNVMTKGGWIVNALGNHDFARLVSRFGDDKKYHKESAKMLITLMATQNGTLNIYQGDEIGMTNINLKNIDEVNDIQSRNFYFENLETQKFSKDVAIQMINNEGRDNARTPMQWNSEYNAGFSKHTPWFQVNPNYKTINVQQQANNSESILNYYKTILSLKREHDVFTYGRFEEFEENNKNVYAYTKTLGYQMIVVFLNFSKNENVIDYEFDMQKNYDILINNYKFVTKTLTYIKLQPYQSIVFKIN
ncbi:alpha-glucosidase [Flavobacterium sp. CS20]|uniref:glycoside hydrolase family 13 protein n=1 Tax=Flavobacterium sp. CS20 TaxID=2775246 RepID=UPI001B3A4781|nr:alpha-glucosidase [Flavobacterium sp. CS20]QTY27276.1 alpha-glucosidase [Flavobacterium sp. CS20]